MVSPIALFAYNRPEKVKFAIESLAKNDLAEVSDLYIFVDGPKSSTDIQLTQQVVETVHTVNGFKSINLKISERNLGLARSIRRGIDFILNFAPTIIVIEDDLILAQDFLNYVNEGLDRFAFDNRVASIQGYQYPISPPLQRAVALRGADCWGWGTWKNRWKSSIFDANVLDRQIRTQNLQYEFDLFGAMPYTKMLQDQMEGNIDSWAICWHASMFIRGSFSIYPAQSLVINNGNDGMGTHGNQSRMFDTKLGSWNVEETWPEPENNIEYQIQMSNYFRFHLQNSKPNTPAMVKHYLKKYLRLNRFIKKYY